MRKILRLLLLKECNRKCYKCCNKDWDLNKLPKVKNFKNYDEIILTGGEPVLKPLLIKEVIKKIRKVSKAKIYMYTALLNIDTIDLLKILDGITLTFHNQTDANNFKLYETYFNKVQSKSLRLNVFEGISIKSLQLNNWIIKKHIRWIKNCPLPNNEVFMRYF